MDIKTETFSVNLQVQKTNLLPKIALCDYYIDNKKACEVKTNLKGSSVYFKVKHGPRKGKTYRFDITDMVSILTNIYG